MGAISKIKKLVMLGIVATTAAETAYILRTSGNKIQKKVDKLRKEYDKYGELLDETMNEVKEEVEGFKGKKPKAVKKSKKKVTRKASNKRV